ncbi:MAG: hypothetical protein ACTHW7_04645 [Actinomycetaceae bacterium]
MRVSFDIRLVVTLLAALGMGACVAAGEDSSTATRSTSPTPSESPTAAQHPTESPTDVQTAVATEITWGQLQEGQVEEGVTYVVDGLNVVMPDGGEMEVTPGVSEVAHLIDGELALPPGWLPAWLTLTLEDGVTPDDMGIERVPDGWIDTGEITFRVTDVESEPPTAVLVDFESRY